MDGLFFAVCVTKSELAVEAYHTDISEESGSASNSSTLDLFSLSLFHRYDRSHFVDTLGNCYAIDRVSKHRGPVMSHAMFSVVDR